MTPASPLTAAGIAAAKAGDLAGARVALTDAVRANSEDATTWLWLSAAVAFVEERRYCLQHVLRIIPASPAGRKGTAQLGKGPTTSLLLVAPVVAAPVVPAPMQLALVALPPPPPVSVPVAPVAGKSRQKSGSPGVAGVGPISSWRLLKSRALLAS